MRQNKLNKQKISEVSLVAQLSVFKIIQHHWWWCASPTIQNYCWEVTRVSNRSLFCFCFVHRCQVESKNITIKCCIKFFLTHQFEFIWEAKTINGGCSGWNSNSWLWQPLDSKNLGSNPVPSVLSPENDSDFWSQNVKNMTAKSLYVLSSSYISHM